MRASRLFDTQHFILRVNVFYHSNRLRLVRMTILHVLFQPLKGERGSTCPPTFCFPMLESLEAAPAALNYVATFHYNLPSYTHSVCVNETDKILL